MTFFLLGFCLVGWLGLFTVVGVFLAGWFLGWFFRSVGMGFLLFVLFGFFLRTWHSQYSLHLTQPSLQIPLQICQEGSYHHLLAGRKSHTRITILLFLLMTCILISVRDPSCSSILCVPCQAIHIHSSFNLIS